MRERTCVPLGICCLLLAAVASGAPEQEANSGDEREAALFGVVTDFALKTAEIKQADDVQITLKMTNVTRDPVKFRYSAFIEQHVNLFNEKGEVVHHKMGAPILECPYLEIEIQPGATVDRTTSFAFGRYYSVRAGTYAIAFEYDTRLMKPPEQGKDPWVLWSKARLKVTLKDSAPDAVIPDALIRSGEMQGYLLGIAVLIVVVSIPYYFWAARKKKTNTPG